MDIGRDGEQVRKFGVVAFYCEPLRREAPDFTHPTAIIMGSEEDGVSPEYLKMSDCKAKIPMSGKISSLNVSVASAIIVYEAIRQRG